MPGLADPSSGAERPVSPTNISAPAASAYGADDDMSRFIRNVISAATQPWKPPSPSQLSAYSSFRSGKSIDEIAKDKDIRPGTVRDYVLSATLTLRAGTAMLKPRHQMDVPLSNTTTEGSVFLLSLADKERLVSATSSAAYLPMVHRRMLKSIRAEIRAAYGGDGAESASEGGEEVNDIPSGRK